MEQIEVLTDEQLRSELLVFNANIGPITDTTRTIYRLKLLNYLTKASANDLDTSSSSGRSAVMNDVIPSEHDRSTNMSAARSQDDFLQSQQHTRVEASGDVAPNVNKSFQQAKPFPNKVADMRSGSQTQSPMSPNMTSTPHFGGGASVGVGGGGIQASPSPARNPIGTTPISSGSMGLQSTNYSQAKLFGDVPTNYPQLRHRVQPSAGSTPSAAAAFKPYPVSSTARATVSSTSYSYNGNDNPSKPQKRGFVFYMKFAIYCFLCFVIFLAFLVWLNMEPAVSV